MLSLYNDKVSQLISGNSKVLSGFDNTKGHLDCRVTHCGNERFPSVHARHY